MQTTTKREKNGEREGKKGTFIYLEETITCSRRLATRGPTCTGIFDALIDLMSYDGVY